MKNIFLFVRLVGIFWNLVPSFKVASRKEKKKKKSVKIGEYHN